MIDPGFTSLFDGTSLAGWRAVPRTYGTVYPGGPHVLDVAAGFPRDYNDRAAERPAVAPESGTCRPTVEPRSGNGTVGEPEVT